jgi:nucleoside-specific outer membrane channel protein Tsx
MTFVAGLALAATTTQAAEWSDTSVHYWYSSNFAEPAIHGGVEKSVVSLEHVSGYKYGSNFFNVDFLFSAKQDSARGLNFVNDSGAVEAYAVYRHTLSFSKVSGSKVAFGPVRDVGLVLGADWNTKNNAFSSKKIMPIGGVKFSFDVPGFLDFAIQADKEWNENAITGTTIAFDPSLQLSLAWGLPVFGPVAFEGFANLVTPKGKDAFGEKTVTEILLHPKLMADVATLWGGKGVQVGIGFQYWMNKFGTDSDKNKGCVERATFVEAAVHL